MKFKVKREILLEALNNVSKAISNKNIIPILSGIKFDLSKEKLVLTASDNDITIQTELKKSDDFLIDGSGSIVIKGKYIFDIIRKLDSEYINFELVDNSKVLIYTENSEFNLNGIESNEYPAVDLVLDGEKINISVGDFRKIISQTNYACSLDEARLVLTGVNLKIGENSLECSATDSYRLALKKIDLVNKINNDIDIIVPSKNLNELTKILPFDDTMDFNIYIYSNKVIFEFNDIIFQSRLINGTYPNIKNLIPSNKLFDLKLNKKDFYNMVDRASILNNDRDNNIITLDLDEKLLKITSMSLEIGKVEEKMNVDVDDTIRISFSSRYMMDALRNIEGDEVILTFVGEINPILIKSATDSTLICLILPIRTY